MSSFDEIYKSGPVIAITRNPGVIWQIESSSESIWRVGLSHTHLPVDLLSLVPNDDHDIITRKIGAAILQQRPDVILRYRIGTGRQVRWVEDYCSFTYDESGQVQSASSLLWVTTLPLEWHLLSKGVEAWNLLTSKLRHDMLNQLTAILGYLELSADMISDPMLVDFAGKEQNAAERIREKLIFTREFQKIGLTETEWIKLPSLLAEVVRESGCNRIEVTTDIGEVRIFVDKIFKQALIRLFENIPIHAPSASMIHIQFIPAPSGGTLVIQDNGPGIPPDQKIRIFEVGFGTGDGFGLFLTEKILGIFNIQINETGVFGSGARFELTIPGDILEFQ